MSGADNGQSEAVMVLASALVEMGRKMADDPELRGLMGVSAEGDLPPDILPRAALIAFMEHARVVAGPALTIEWLDRTVEQLARLQGGLKHNV